MAQSVFFCGCLVGVVLAGLLADRLGRWDQSSCCTRFVSLREPSNKKGNIVSLSTNPIEMEVIESKSFSIKGHFSCTSTPHKFLCFPPFLIYPSFTLVES